MNVECRINNNNSSRYLYVYSTYICHVCRSTNKFILDNLHVSFLNENFSYFVHWTLLSIIPGAFDASTCAINVYAAAAAAAATSAVQRDTLVRRNPKTIKSFVYTADV